MNPLLFSPMFVALWWASLWFASTAPPVHATAKIIQFKRRA